MNSRNRNRRGRELIPHAIVVFLFSCFFFEGLHIKQPRAETTTPEISEQTLDVCSGYDPLQNHWGPWGKQNGRTGEDHCPPGEAFLAHDYVAGSRWQPINAFSIAGYCCKLPKGVLSEEHVFAAEQCPEGFVITGSRAETVPDQSGNSTGRAVTYSFRCTRIDTTRFTLGPPSQGWGVGLPNDTWEQLAHLLRYGARENLTTRGRLPIALRYGLFRTGPSTWGVSGCVGVPWGSILTGRINKYCFGHIFRELRYKDTSPVKTYPDCLTVSSPFDVNPSCIAKED